MNDYRDDDVLFSIGTVGLAEKSDEHDTSSDSSDWVKQYTAWEEGNDYSNRNRTVIVQAESVPNYLGGIKDRSLRAAEAVAPAC